MKIRKDVLDLAFPIIAEQAFVIIMGMVNTIMAGHLGKEAVSAIGMVDSFNNILIAFFSALAVGGTVVIAQYTGQKNYKKANESAVHAILSSLAISIIITVLIYFFRTELLKVLYGSAEQSVLDNSYTYLNITLLTYPLIAASLIASGILRGVGDTKTPMKISIIMNILNVILSYTFIYGFSFHNAHINFGIPGYGVKGAAIGIAISRTAGTIMYLLILICGTKTIRLKVEKDFKISFDILKSIFGIGLPASVENVLFNVGKLITQVFIVGLGTASIAGNYVASSVFGLINIPGSALSIAAITMVGQSMGRGDSENAKDVLLYLTKLTSVCLLVISLFTFPFARLLASMYTNADDVISIAAGLIRTAALSMPTFWALSFILPAGLKGAGDGKYTMIVAIFSMWAFRVGFGYLLCIPLGLGVLGVWLGMYIDWVIRGIFFYMRLQRGKWKENVVIKTA